MANAYVVEEASTFRSYYFEPHVHTRRRQVPRNDDGGNFNFVEGNLSIFTYPVRAYGTCKRRSLDQQEYMAAQTYIILNCAEVQPYVK